MLTMHEGQMPWGIRRAIVHAMSGKGLLMTANSSQNISQKTLSMLFASSARAIVLRLFMVDPYRAYYQRQIEKSTGLAIRARRLFTSVRAIRMVNRSSGIAVAGAAAAIATR